MLPSGMPTARVKGTAKDPDWDARGGRWWSHVQVLADDGMEGRDTGSPGYQRAADYVVEQFRAAGLAPGGSEGFLQPIDFEVSQLDERASSLSLLRTGEPAQPLKLREDAQIAATTQTARDLEADLVFVGYGLRIPELKYDDLAGLDLKGKIAVYFRGGPSVLPGPIKAHFQSVKERLLALRTAGAVGSIQILNPKIPDAPWSRIAIGLVMSRMELSARASDEPRPLPIALALNPERLDLLLAGSGHTAAEVLQGLGGPEPLPRFPLAVRLRVHAEVRRSTARSSNVVGVLRGADPKLRDEYVVATAHLDHLGIGEPINGERIYRGAMDNASGIASLIEIARAVKDSGHRPKRSLVFLAVTGEEKGLLGSEYFAGHPTVSGRIVAELNMDMFMPLFPLKYLEIQGLGESSLGADIREIARPRGVEVQPDPEPERVLFIRSDQYSFVKRGVPSLALSIGYRKGTPEERIATAFFLERYHSPTDDLEQPVDRVAAAQFTDLLGQLMVRVADAPEPPHWNSDSFFRRFVR